MPSSSILKLSSVCLSVSLSVCLSLCLSVTFLLPCSNHYISAKYRDNDTKLSGYDHEGLPSISWCQGWPCLPCLLSGTLNVLQVPPSMRGGSWHTPNHARMLKIGTQVGNPMSRTIMRSRMTHVLHVFDQEPSMSSKSLMMMEKFLTHF